jgi:long-subunit fatty acid transport protein
MGTAFVGAADDATAAFTNPAGLARRDRREVSAELRYKRLDSPFLRGGRVNGAVTGIGLDTVSTPLTGHDRDSHFGPAFASALWPVKASWGFTVYTAEVAAIDNKFLNEGAFVRTVTDGVITDRNRENPVGGSRSVRIGNYGAAVAYKSKTREWLSIGGGVSLYRFSLQADFARYGIIGDFAGPVDTSRTIATAVQDAHDWSPGFNTGVLLGPFTLRDSRADSDGRPRTAHFITVGASFRLGPRFGFTQHDQVPSSGLDLQRSGRFKVPDVWSAGAVWEHGRTRVLVDYDRVQYSQLMDDFIQFQSLASGRGDQLRLNDGDELHGGVEIRVPKVSFPLAVRGGLWYDPDHAVRYQPTAANDATDALFSSTLPGGESVVHYTFGAGVNLIDRVEVNGAADLSSRTKYATLSVVIRP